MAGTTRAHAADPCEQGLLSPTDNFIAYLDALVQAQILTPERLASLQNGRDESTSDSRSSEWLVHREAIRHHSRNVEIDRDQVAAWLTAMQAAIHHTAAVRHSTQTETRDYSAKFSFVRVPGGFTLVISDLAGRTKEGSRRSIMDVDNFEITRTLITRGQWRRYMQRFPEKHPKSVLDINDDELPVENITWWSAAMFANRVSIAEGLPPFYRVEGFSWLDGTSAEAGTLQPAAGFNDFPAWHASHYDSRTDAGGYRLPFGREYFRSLAEGLGPKRQREPNKFIWHDLGSGYNFMEIGWTADNSGGYLHSTTEEEKFVVIGGEKIFDLVGNVKQWTSDLYQTASDLDFRTQERRLVQIGVFGGSWATSYASAVRSPSTYQLMDNGELTGFRLARTLPPPIQ